MKTRHKVTIGIVCGGLVAGLVFAAPLRWSAGSMYRAVFPEQDPERPVYDDTAMAPVDLAAFVRQARVAWPQADYGTVHQAAIEVAAGLLHHPDIEIGSWAGGTFVPWRMTAWSAAAKIKRELSASHGYFSEEGRYVFRRR